MKRHVPQWAYFIKKELCKLSQIYYKASKKLQGWQKHCFEVWGSWRTTSPTRRWSTPPPSTSASSLQGQLIVNQERKKVFCYFFQKLFFFSYRPFYLNLLRSVQSLVICRIHMTSYARDRGPISGLG